MQQRSCFSFLPALRSCTLTWVASIMNYQGGRKQGNSHGRISKGYLTNSLDKCGALYQFCSSSAVLKTNELDEKITKTGIILDAQKAQSTRATKRMYKSECLCLGYLALCMTPSHSSILQAPETITLVL